MIDSCNFLIKGISYIDFKYLKRKGIYYTKKTHINRYGFKEYEYRFKYKGILFKFYYNRKNMIIITNAHRILNKKDITLSDISEYETKVDHVIKEILNTDKFKKLLNRIDYYVDLPLNDKLMFYISIMRNVKSKYHYMKQFKFYSTSIYLKTKYGQTNINSYARYSKTKKKEDKGIFRIEVQCKPKKIKRVYENYGVCKEIQEYWNRYAMEEYFFNFLSKYLYEGNYYKKERAYEIINSSNISKTRKSNIKKFIRDIYKNGFDGVIKMNKYCRETMNTYIDILNELKVNPVLLPDWYSEGGKTVNELEGLLAMARRIAEKKYFK